jgi:hypothetical protein
LLYVVEIKKKEKDEKKKQKKLYVNVECIASEKIFLWLLKPLMILWVNIHAMITIY